MRLKKLAAVAFVLLGVAFATVEDTFVHTDDGCAVETHCNACLLRLGTTGVVAARFSLMPVAAEGTPVVAARPAWHEDAAPRRVSSRGPPHA
jgi:hypothetical protein